MTKRFTGEFDKQYSGVHDNGEQLTNFEVVDLLNDLSEDNEYLEKRFKEEEWHYNHIDEDRDVWMHKCQELEKENEELKKDCSNLIEDNTEYVAEINQMHKENEELKKEKEFWKSDACSLSNLNSILSNELSIAQEQGYEPSIPYKEYITSIKTEYDKFWENKIKTHNNRLKELQE